MKTRTQKRTVASPPNCQPVVAMSVVFAAPVRVIARFFGVVFKTLRERYDSTEKNVSTRFQFAADKQIV